MSKEEKLLILQMVSDGKITPEQGAELLRAVGAGAAPAEPPKPTYQTQKQAPTDASTRIPEQDLGRHLSLEIQEGLRRAVDRAVGSAEEAAERAASQAERAAAGVERRVDRVGHQVSQYGEKVRAEGEELGRNLEDSLTGLGKTIARIFGGGFGPGGPERDFHEEITGEFPSEGVLDVRLATSNGRITVKTWDQPGFHLDVQKKVKAGSDAEAQEITKDAFTFAQDGNVLEARSRDGHSIGWRSVAVGFILTLPRERKASLRLDSSNGRITIEGTGGPQLTASTANGRIMVNGCNFDASNISTANGRIEYEGQAKELTASTANGRVVANLQGAGDWKLDSANGRIEVNISKAPGVGYEVEASTVMGRIEVTGLDDVIIDETKQKIGSRRYKARTLGFGESAFKATLRASTAMGKVTVSV